MIPNKEFIEVALPSETIDKEAVQETCIRNGHPSTLHLRWACRPLAAARAVILTPMVDDLSGHLERFKIEREQEKGRDASGPNSTHGYAFLVFREAEQTRAEAIG